MQDDRRAGIFEILVNSTCATRQIDRFHNTIFLKIFHTVQDRCDTNACTYIKSRNHKIAC